MANNVQYRQDVQDSSASHDEIALTHDGPSFNMPAIRAVITREKKTILLSGLATFIAASLLAFFLPSKYTSTASIIPPGASASGGLAGQLSALSGLAGGGLFGAAKNSGDLYVGILKSRTIRAALVKEFHLEQVYGVKKESQAEKMLAAESEFMVGTKDSIVTISVTNHSPELAHNLTNAYLQQLEKTNSELALTESSQRRSFYEKRLAQEKEALANAEVALKQTQEKTGLIAPVVQTTSKIQALAQVRSEIIARQVQLAALLHSETEGANDVVQLRAEIANLESQVSRMQGSKAADDKNMSTAQVPELALEYIRKARDVSYHETLFGILAKQYEAARLDEAQDSPLQVLDQAEIPDSKSGPPRFFIAIGGLLLGLFASTLWLVYKSQNTVLAHFTR